MILRPLHPASAYHQLPFGVSVIRCHHTLHRPEITVGGASKVRSHLRRTLKNTSRHCFLCWSHALLASESVRQSFPSSSVVPFTTKISLPAYTSLPKFFSALLRWASRLILIYTFLAMTPIHPKTSNQAMEPTASRRTIQLCMSPTFSSAPTHALARGGSSYSR